MSDHNDADNDVCVDYDDDGNKDDDDVDAS